MSEDIAKRFLVAGRVQGVYYRASTRAKAQELGLRGHARNLADGRVEVMAVGDPVAVDVLEKWLWQGPPAAHVVKVESEQVDADALKGQACGFLTR